MSITVYYEGTFKKSGKVDEFVETVKSHSDNNGWAYTILESGISVDIPDSEALTFDLQDGKVSGFVKYFGYGQDACGNHLWS